MHTTGKMNQPWPCPCPTCCTLLCVCRASTSLVRFLRLGHGTVHGAIMRPATALASAQPSPSPSPSPYGAPPSSAPSCTSPDLTFSNWLCPAGYPSDFAPIVTLSITEQYVCSTLLPTLNILEQQSKIYFQVTRSILVGTLPSAREARMPEEPAVAGRCSRQALSTLSVLSMPDADKPGQHE